MAESAVEPWLRGTLGEVGAVARGVIHALELAREDVQKWCGGLTDDELNARPFGLPTIAFHLRHIARSLDRLLTYAEGGQLDALQTSALKREMNESATREEVFAEFSVALENAKQRIRALDGSDPEQRRFVGRQNLLSSLGGLLVHIADHTQRHEGQAITTAKVLLAQRDRQTELAASMP